MSREKSLNVLVASYRVLLSFSFLILTFSPAFSQNCLDCHKTKSPLIVSDWLLSQHGRNDVGCNICHGEEHKGSDDVSKARIPTLETCALCHENKVNQFKKGKHAFAWAAMKALPTAHWQPMALIEGMKGCGGCHKIGLKTEAEIKELKATGAGFGYASCDACHTRHLFSVAEARQPQACQTCHMGFDHPQWEMYSASKHGVRFLLKQNKVLPENAAAPTCQTCHMSEGNHEVRTAWGFLAIRLPLPQDKSWAEDQAIILQGLGVFDPEGKPTPRLEIFKSIDAARLTPEAWQKERDKMNAICIRCHSANFARAELEKGDKLIREADKLMAEAIKIVAGLYKDGLLSKTKNYAYAFPDLLTFHDAPTVIEQRLFVMFLENRMRTFQGAFHHNSSYSLWYGWSEMVRSLTEIRELAEEYRIKAKK